MSLPEENKKSVKELTVWLWPGTGLEPFIEEYDLAHSEVEINIVLSEFEVVQNNLQTAFAVGYGAPDIALIEVSFIERFKAFPQHFNNLYNFGAGEIRNQYLDWKWAQTLSADQTFSFGLPTDIGPIAMAYRPDFFRMAGLPTERLEVEELLLTWDDFLEVGVMIKERTGKSMVDNIQILYRMILGQARQQYFDRESGRLIVETNPGVKRAWDYAVKAKELELSADLPTWDPVWGAGMTNGDFAVKLLPAWMFELVKDHAPSISGQWDVTSAPEGGGNWGGSFLTLPNQGKNPKDAYELIVWLTSAEQQLEVFKERNNFPSNHNTYNDPIILEKRDEYFGGAPIGQILIEAAENIKPVYEGARQHIVQMIIESALDKVENEETDPETAWDEAMVLIKKELMRN